MAERVGGVGPGDIILISNSEYKFRFLDAVTKKCRRVALAPCFGLPVSRPACARERKEGGGARAESADESP